LPKVLFIENRGKTRFWAEVARAFAARGNEIAWMVQNPAFQPSTPSGAVNLLPFPASGQPEDRLLGDNWVSEHYPDLIGDRGRRYFHGNCDHYEHYDAVIGEMLDHLQPDAVIGEPTLFHELLTIGQCRKRRIPYLHPTASRYPGGRFTVFSGDTQNSLGRSGDRIAPAEARDLAERIASSRVLPAYMTRKRGMAQARTKLAILKAHATAWTSHLRGERYNTPSLRRKRELDRRLQANLARWKSLQKLPAAPGRTLLYPLQMQPEANLDVWGRDHLDQVATIQTMLAASRDDVTIAVKANPKSKYEVSDGLLKLAELEPRVCLLPLDLPMPSAQAVSIGALTVTGTVGFEAVFGKGRTLSLCHPVLEAEFPSFHARSVTDAVDRLLYDPKAGQGGLESGTRLLQTFMDQSFPGLINEPLYDARCIEPANVKRVADVLEALIQRPGEMVSAR
jgi:hypothetical protein